MIITNIYEGITDASAANERLKWLEDKLKIEALEKKERKTTNYYKTTVISDISFGDSTSDYTRAISSVAVCKQMYDSLLNEGKILNTTFQNKYQSNDSLIIFSSAQNEYYMAKSDYLVSLKKWMSGEGDEKETIQKTEIVKEKIEILQKMKF